MEVNGTFIWYYHICEREVWLIAHNITPDQHDDNIDYGRFLHEQTYKRNQKEIEFGNVKFDVIFDQGDKLVIGETKKSSRYQEASRWQLLYYLRVLQKAGIDASGVLLYPQEKKRVEVTLTKEKAEKLADIESRIREIAEDKYPPAPRQCKFCGKCAYEEYCWA